MACVAASVRPVTSLPCGLRATYVKKGMPEFPNLLRLCVRMNAAPGRNQPTATGQAGDSPRIGQNLILSLAFSQVKNCGWTRYFRVNIFRKRGNCRDFSLFCSPQAAEFPSTGA